MSLHSIERGKKKSNELEIVVRHSLKQNKTKKKDEQDNVIPHLMCVQACRSRFLIFPLAYIFDGEHQRVDV